MNNGGKINKCGLARIFFIFPEKSFEWLSPSISRQNSGLKNLSFKAPLDWGELEVHSLNSFTGEQWSYIDKPLTHPTASVLSQHSPPCPLPGPHQTPVELLSFHRWPMEPLLRKKWRKNKLELVFLVWLFYCRAKESWDTLIPVPDSAGTAVHLNLFTALLVVNLHLYLHVVYHTTYLLAFFSKPLFSS